MLNTTLVDNAGIAFYADGTVIPTLTNCILWTNSGDQISGPTTPVVTFGLGNIDSDPLLESGPAGTWTADSIVDSAGLQSTFTDANASYAPGELVGAVISPAVLFGPTFRSVIAENTAPIPACAAPACACDLEGDGAVGAGDLLMLLAGWAAVPAGPADIDGDGNVDTADLLELLANWGPC